MFNDKQTKRNRLHKGDMFQNYNGEPTLLGIFCGALLMGLIISLIYII